MTTTITPNRTIAMLAAQARAKHAQEEAEYNARIEANRRDFERRVTGYFGPELMQAMDAKPIVPDGDGGTIYLQYRGLNGQIKQQKTASYEASIIFSRPTGGGDVYLAFNPSDGSLAPDHMLSDFFMRLETLADSASAEA